MIANSVTTLQSESTAPSGATRRRKLLFAALLCAFWAAIYIPGLFRPALLDDADTIHAEAARNMLVRGDPVTLYIDVGLNPPAHGVRYLEKPPLPYWLVALSYKAFGVSEWSTRLPLALGVLALALYLLKLGGDVYGGAAGFYAGLVMLTCFGVYLFTRFFIPDLLVGLWLAIGFGFFLRTLDLGEAQSSAGGEAQSNASASHHPAPRLACWGLAAVTALDVLTKGLIGLVFPAAVIFIYLVLTRNLRHLLRMRLLSSSAVFLALAAPWHVAAALANPPAGKAQGFVWFYFVNEHFKRFLGTRFPRDYDTVPLVLFWALLIVWLLPWIAFLPQALAQLRATKIWQRFRNGAASLSRAEGANLLFLIWALVIYGFFSFSTRQEYYILPTLPALALVTGCWLGRESAAAQTPDSELTANLRPMRAGRISAAILLVFGVAAFIVTVSLAAESKVPPPGVDISVLLQQHPQDYALSMGHFLDLTPQALGAFRGPLIGTGISLLLGTFLCWWWRRAAATGNGAQRNGAQRNGAQRNGAKQNARRLMASNLALAVAMAVMLYCAHVALVTFGPTLSSKQLALEMKQQFRPGDVVVINGNLENASSLPFYTGIQAHVLGPQSNMWYGSLFPDAPPVYETRDSLQQLWRSNTRVFLWSEADDIPVRLLRNPVFAVARGGGKIILSNQPNR